MQQTLIITGTSKGIGRSLAEHYLAAGWNVVGCSRGAAQIEHERYRHQAVDVNDEAGIVRMVREVVRREGAIDALINNAGIAAMNHLLTTPLISAQRVMNTNFLGSFLFLREVAKAMVKAKAGRIVNFTTVAVPLHLEGESVYAASKAAVESLTRIAARELAPFGITVNAVGPTPIGTDLIKAVPESKIQALLARQAFPRLGTFEDIANVTDFFLSPRSKFVTGQVLYLGGVTP
jgi:3-oxoacyl-[acyl-carrier protein] reductase